MKCPDCGQEMLQDEVHEPERYRLFWCGTCKLEVLVTKEKEPHE